MSETEIVVQYKLAAAVYFIDHSTQAFILQLNCRLKTGKKMVVLASSFEEYYNQGENVKKKR